MNDRENFKIGCEQFYKITQIDIAKYFLEFSTFIEGEYSIIVQYYSGNLSLFNDNAFSSLESLVHSFNEVERSIIAHEFKLNSTLLWEICDTVESVRNTLKTISNISKWLRSTIPNSVYQKNIEYRYITKQNQTLERVSTDIVEQNIAWTDIALRNDLDEEDYSLEGGLNIFLPATNDGATIDIQSVVDTMIGFNAYGKDLLSKITYESDDLSTVSKRECLIQSASILSSLLKGSDPYNANFGVDSALAIGSNSASFNFPVIARQIQQTFSTDDTFSSGVATEINLQSPNAFIQINVKSRFEDDFTSKFLLLE